MMIAGDAMIALGWRYGVPGVTMSSRMGTAAAHGHAWGRFFFWFLDHTPWLGFGKDKVTGESHCVGAIKNDSTRAAVDALRELLGDPVVVSAFNLEPFKAELLAQVRAILEPSP
jgi:hypothetical protein